MKLLAATILVISVFLAACADPSANKTKAVTTNPTANSAVNAPPNTAASNPAVAFSIRGSALPIDNATSKVEFTGSKVTGKHDGGFKAFNGTIDLVDEKAADSKVQFEIDMSSVFTDTDGLTKHLQTGDFFEVEKFPRATFYSKSIVADGAKGVDGYIVTGDMTLHGVTKSVTFPATIKVEPAMVSVNSEFSINRKDFGIVYAGKADDLIRDDVVLRLGLNAPRKK